jgi:hypothetical protein
MITVTQCAAFAGLASDELIVGISPSAKHSLLLSSYLLNLERGPLAVRDMIIADLRRFMSLERGSIQPICCSCCGFFFPTIHVQDASKLEIVFGRTANHELADSDFEVAASSSEQ